MDHMYEQPPELDEARSFTDSQILTTNQIAADSAGYRQPCSNGGCPLEDPHPMEQVWLELMSPVPVAGQNIEQDVDPNVSLPDSRRFQEVLGALRPFGVDDHAMDTVKNAWSTMAEDQLSPIPERLRLKLAELSQSWEGDDFDAFAEQVDLARSNLINTIHEIATATYELELLEERVYAAQGSGVVPFPAPGVWKASDGVLKGPQIHVRHAWFEGGDCDKDRDAEDNWEAIGMPRETGDHFQQLINERAQYFIDHHGMDPAQAQQQAEEDYTQASMMPLIGHWSNQMILAVETHNEGIVRQRDLVAEFQHEPSLEHNQRAQPEIIPDDFDMTLPPLDPPPTPELPPLGNHDDYAPPGQQAVPEFPDPRADWSPSQLPANSPADLSMGTGSGGGSSDGGLWSSPELDPDEMSGGLASGGAGGIGGAGLPSGGGAGAGAGAGMAGGVVGAPAGGVGGAGGAGRGRAAAGSGRGGMMGAGGGGGRPAGSSEEDQAGRDTWLTEDEDVWGLVSEEDDPYA